MVISLRVRWPGRDVNSPSRSEAEDGRNYACALPYAFKARAEKTSHFTFPNTAKYSSEHKDFNNELLHWGKTTESETRTGSCAVWKSCFSVTITHNHTGCLFYGVCWAWHLEGTVSVCHKAATYSDTRVLRSQNNSITIQELNKYLRIHVLAVLVSCPFV